MTAKAEIAKLLRERAAAGLCVLMVNSELDEVARSCDRALVFFRGRVAAELGPTELQRPRMLQAVLGAA
ncbi:MAG: hypothetical protein QM756_03355 [Polyangiaceae bacterium]